MLGILGCSVTVVGDGAAGLQAVQAERFDVVLMDVMMPGINGLEATRLLRQLSSDRVEQPWIIAMSAGARPDERRRCQEAGMDDFLSKPAWLEDLEAALLRVPARSR
jgi:CheY-like chemotaxis protein